MPKPPTLEVPGHSWRWGGCQHYESWDLVRDDGLLTGWVSVGAVFAEAVEWTGKRGVTFARLTSKGEAAAALAARVASSGGGS